MKPLRNSCSPTIRFEFRLAIPASTEATNPALGCEKNILRRWMTGQPGHCEDIAAQRNDEARTGGEPDFADIQGEASRSTF